MWPYLQKTPMAVEKEEEEAEAEVQPDPLNQLILHFSHNALTERRFYMIIHMHTQETLCIYPIEIKMIELK